MTVREGKEECLFEVTNTRDASGECKGGTEERSTVKDASRSREEAGRVHVAI